jgi:hypothetical protein
VKPQTRLDMILADRLLNEEYPAARREAAHQMLRALEYKAPSKMRKTN